MAMEAKDEMQEELSRTIDDQGGEGVVGDTRGREVDPHRSKSA